MRQPSVGQSYLRQPLNSMLGTPVSVRALRELILEGDALSPSTIANRGRVTPHAVRKTLSGLLEAGIVESVGEGRSVLYRIRVDHPLASALETLFRAEAARVQEILSGLRKAAAELAPAPLALWVHGGVARGEDTAASEFDVALVAPDESGGALSYAFRDLVKELATKQRLTISIIAVSPADVLRYAGGAGTPWWRKVTEGAIPLFGSPPDLLASALQSGKV